MKKKRRFRVIEDKCARCFMCQLICSLNTEGVYSPAKSKIMVDWSGSGECKITFTPECTECGLCVTHCIYGALDFA